MDRKKKLKGGNTDGCFARKRVCSLRGVLYPKRNTQVYYEQCRETIGGKGYRMKIRYDRASESVSRRFVGLDMVPVTFICRQCGEEFLNKGHKKTFCSRGCYLANIQATRAIGHTVPYRVCGKPVKVNYNPTTAKMQRKAATVWCSACSQKDFEEAAKARKLRENECKAAEMKAGEAKEAKFLMENGLCTVCTTSYTKCERMQTGFRVSPKGVQYRDSKVVCCSKFKAKLKYCSLEQFTGTGAAESKAEGSIKTAG